MQTKRGNRETAPNLESCKPLPIRDHYERWAHFSKRQYPKQRPTQFTDVELIDRAIAAGRDTPLGIIDTIAREFITHWLPECMLFWHQPADKQEDYIEAYKALATGLRSGVIDILKRIQCDKDEAAVKLRGVLQESAESQLQMLFDVCGVKLTDDEKPRYDPKRAASVHTDDLETNQNGIIYALSPLKEARILNSSLAWDLSDSQSTPHPLPAASLKRRFSQSNTPSPDLFSYPDPADNGQVWNSPPPANKRRKIALRFTSHTDTSTEHFRTPFHTTFRHRSDRDTIDLTADDDDNSNAIRAANRDPLTTTTTHSEGTSESESESEFPIPGSFLPRHTKRSQTDPTHSTQAIHNAH